MSEIRIMPAANTSGWGICISEDGSIICAVKGRDVKDRKANAKRIKNALNALAGRDPEKLEGLLESYKELLSHAWQTLYGTPGEQLWQRSADALAAFEGGSHE